jgi:predicted transcriptional regulator
MKDELNQAIEIVKAQAGIRLMNAEEIISMIDSLSKTISGDVGEETVIQEPAVDPKRAIREKSIVCLECGKSFKILTKKHLDTHDLTAAEYKEKWGYKKGQPLACKSLSRQRKNKMAEMELWKRKKDVKDDIPEEIPQRRTGDKKVAILDRDKPKTEPTKNKETPDWDAIADTIIQGN